MKRLNKVRWTPTERTQNGKYAVMRLAVDGAGKATVEYYLPDDPFIFADRKTAQRAADDLNEAEAEL